MKKIVRKEIIRIGAVLFAIMLLTTSCSLDKKKGLIEKSLPYAKKTIVLPFKDMSKIYGKKNTIKSLISGDYFITGKVEEGANDFMTESLVALLGKKEKFEIIGYSAISETSFDTLSEFDLLIKAGKKQGADNVFAGYIYKFEERIGTDYSVDSPASVSFSIYLIDVDERTIMQSLHFDETQQSLTDNLFGFASFFKRHGKWITAKDMAYSGMSDMLEKL